MANNQSAPPYASLTPDMTRIPLPEINLNTISGKIDIIKYLYMNKVYFTESFVVDFEKYIIKLFNKKLFFVGKELAVSCLKSLVMTYSVEFLVNNLLKTHNSSYALKIWERLYLVPIFMWKTIFVNYEFKKDIEEQMYKFRKKHEQYNEVQFIKEVEKYLE